MSHLTEEKEPSAKQSQFRKRKPWKNEEVPKELVLLLHKTNKM